MLTFCKAFPHHCQYHKAMQHKGLANLWTSIARAREADTNYRVFIHYKKGVFGVHKGVVFRTVLKGLEQVFGHRRG